MSSLELAAEAFATGHPVLLAGLGGERAVVAVAAARADAGGLAALHDLAGGIVVLGLETEAADRLGLAALRRTTRRLPGLTLAAPVDAADCEDGGWSLRDQAHTIRVAVQPDARPGDLTVPGHVHAGIVDRGGSSAPAIALELARVAAQAPAVLVSSVLDRDRSAVSLPAARRVDRLRGLPAAPVDELHGLAVTRRDELDSVGCALPTRLGDFRVLATANADEGEVTVTLVHGDPAAARQGPVHTHVACLLGDTFGSMLCDCHGRLQQAAEEIRARRAGMIIYVKPGVNDPFVCPRASMT